MSRNRQIRQRVSPPAAHHAQPGPGLRHPDVGRVDHPPPEPVPRSLDLRQQAGERRAARLVVKRQGVHVLQDERLRPRLSKHTGISLQQTHRTIDASRFQSSRKPDLENATQTARQPASRASPISTGLPLEGCHAWPDPRRRQWRASTGQSEPPLAVPESRPERSSSWCRRHRRRIPPQPGRQTPPTRPSDRGQRCPTAARSPSQATRPPFAHRVRLTSHPLPTPKTRWPPGRAAPGPRGRVKSRRYGSATLRAVADSRGALR